MVKGYDQNQERKKILSSFGKDLTRRSGSKCELCKAGNVSLSVCEVSPVSTEPDYDACIFVCEDCRKGIKNPKKIGSGHWRCLNEAVWSDVPAVKVVSVRILKSLEDSEPWVHDLLDEVYLSPEEEEWVQKE